MKVSSIIRTTSAWGLDILSLMAEQTCPDGWKRNPTDNTGVYSLYFSSPDDANNVFREFRTYLRKVRKVRDWTASSVDYDERGAHYTTELSILA